MADNKGSVAGDAHAPSSGSGPEAAAGEQPVAPLAARLRVAAAALVGYSLAATAWRVRHDPQDLAFVAASCLLLAALLVCLRWAERLAPESPDEERRRAQASVWVLSSVLSCGFAYRVAAIMPPALAVVVWCMTAFVVVTGFCLLVLCKDQQYEALEDAGDTKVYYVKFSPGGELV